MPQSMSQKRPWLAALFATLVTGFGHLYLRRWRRALGWIVASVFVSALFVDPAAVDALLAGNWGLSTMLGVAPAYLVVGLSAVDAYLLARIHNIDTRPSAASATDTVSCPHCGNELDPDLEFCHWCTRSVEDVDRDRASDDP